MNLNLAHQILDHEGTTCIHGNVVDSALMLSNGTLVPLCERSRNEALITGHKDEVCTLDAARWFVHFATTPAVPGFDAVAGGERMVIVRTTDDGAVALATDDGRIEYHPREDVAVLTSSDDVTWGGPVSPCADIFGELRVTRSPDGSASAVRWVGADGRFFSAVADRDVDAYLVLVENDDHVTEPVGWVAAWRLQDTVLHGQDSTSTSVPA